MLGNPCSKCDTVLTVENTYVSNTAVCKECCSKQSTLWRRNNPEKRKVIQMRSHRKRWYGVSQETFENRFKAQQGLCAICKDLMVIGNPKVLERACQDHNHETNQLRDLLCARCNLLLGNSRESENILASAIQYLRKHAGSSSIQTTCDDVQSNSDMS